MKKVLFFVLCTATAGRAYAQAGAGPDTIFRSFLPAIKALAPAGGSWKLSFEPDTYTITLSTADPVLLCTAAALFHTVPEPDTSTVRAVWETSYILAPEFTEKDSLAMVAFNDSLAQIDHYEERAAAYATNDTAVIAAMESKLLGEMQAIVQARKERPGIEGKGYCVYMPPPAVITRYGLYDICDDELYRERTRLTDAIYSILEHPVRENRK